MWNKNTGLPYMEGKEKGRSHDLKPMTRKHMTKQVTTEHVQN